MKRQVLVVPWGSVGHRGADAVDNQLFVSVPKQEVSRVGTWVPM